MFNQVSNKVLLDPVQDKGKVQETQGQNHFMFLICVLGCGTLPPSKS